MPPSIDSLDLPPFRPRFPWWGADLQTLAVLLGPCTSDLSPHTSERVCFCMADRSGDILVGNFGDGRINAFDTSGNFMGQFFDPQGNLLTINGLWSLQFGTGAANNGPTDRLFFTAGIANESHGLFGFIVTGTQEPPQ